MIRLATQIACVVALLVLTAEQPAGARSLNIDAAHRTAGSNRLAQAATGETTAPAAPDASTEAPAASSGGAIDATAPDAVVPVVPQSPSIAGPKHNLSPLGMFLAADWVVQSVMGGLVIASLLSWVVWIAKSIDLALTRRELRKARTLLEGARSLTDAIRQISPRMRRASKPILIALAELQSAPPQSTAASIKERIALRMADLVASFSGELKRGTGLLATVGAMAPFVGLFGTVWGIMNSFIGISKTQTTNLAVVAPGIAEALLATAVGLFAAIPAVIFYNRLSRSVASCRAALATLAVDTQLLVSRDLDRSAASPSSPLERVA